MRSINLKVLTSLLQYNEGPESLDDNEHEQLKDILEIFKKVR